MPEQIRGREVFQATEAVFDNDETWITIIKEGESINGRNYRRTTLQKAVDNRVYENIRMFVDHSNDLPLKRSIRELVSGITDTKLDESFPDGKARVRGKVNWYQPEFQVFAEKAKEHIGVSHDAILRGVRSTRNGRRYEEIDEIKVAHSVDWVVYPSAGGGFEQFYAQEGVEVPDAIDWDAIDEEMLKEHKPDLYKSLTTRSTESAKADDDDDDEDEDEQPVPTGIDARSVESIVMRVVDKLETKRSAKEDAHKQVSAAVAKSTLPDRTKARVIRSFEGVDTFVEEDVTAAIKDAEDELAAVAGPRIRNMGPSGQSNGSAVRETIGRAHEAVAAAFGMSPSKKEDKEQ